MKILKMMTLLILFIVLFLSCRDDGYSFDYYCIDIATVENPSQRSSFYFRSDDNKLMFTAASNMLDFYRPNDGQRIIANYTLLNDKSAKSAYQHDVKLNNVYNVLTKDIYYITAGTQDSIGDDPVTISDMWIGGDFLNVQFRYYGLNKIHFINLVLDESKTYNEEKIHLEFRHNAHDDEQSYQKRGIVSFNLQPLKENLINKDELILVIHTKDSDLSEKTFEFKYRVKDTKPERYKTKEKIKIEALTAEID